jgi:predicted transcriptional regulator of viral defense system
MPMKSAELKLRELANTQGGYFTARQAEGFGFVRNHHSYHVSTGNWTREAHGIYKLAGVPVLNPAIEDLHRWLLWTIGRKADAPRGAIAYETALIIHGLSDLTLNKVHLTVPKDFRPSVIPEMVVLHRESRDGGEITERDGLRVVRPFLVVLDLLREGRISIEHIERGFKDGIIKGVITTSEVKKAILLPNEQHLINEWLKEAT